MLQGTLQHWEDEYNTSRCYSPYNTSCQYDATEYKKGFYEDGPVHLLLFPILEYMEKSANEKKITPPLTNIVMFKEQKRETIVKIC